MKQSYFLVKCVDTTKSRAPNVQTIVKADCIETALAAGKSYIFKFLTKKYYEDWLNEKVEGASFEVISISLLDEYEVDYISISEQTEVIKAKEYLDD